MRYHGGLPPACIRHEAGPTAASESSRNNESGRFRTLFGPLAPGEAYQGLQTNGQFDPERTRVMLEKLASRMAFGHRWKGSLPGATKLDDNPLIPSGYTYLAQLAAHDLSQAELPLPELGKGHVNDRNLRQTRLLLDTIYGGGPSGTPSAYERPDPDEPLSGRLRLGLIQAAATDAVRKDRDIPRAACPYLTDLRKQWPETLLAELRDKSPEDLLTKLRNRSLGDLLNLFHSPLPEVLIADHRNDDSLILSQLTAFFHLLHNGIRKKLAESGKFNLTPTGVNEHQRLFDRARRVTAYVFRKIVRDDLLKRLLNAQVHDHYSSGKDEYLDHPESQGQIPAEFSHAAFRFGHAMVRHGYVLNDPEEQKGIDDIVLTTSSRRPGFLPFNRLWVIRWSRFFGIDGATPNLSRRIGPSLTGQLDGDRLFGKFDAGVAGLAYRDLIRGASVPLRSVSSILQRVRSADWSCQLIATISFLNDPQSQATMIRDWLLELGSVSFSAEEIASLTRDPPLGFFILMEAATVEDGTRLGPVGSVIVAEVFFRALSESEQMFAGTFADGESVDSLARAVFGGEIPPTMPALVEAAADLCDLRSDAISFL